MDKRIFWLAAGSFTISTEGFVVSSLLPEIAADAGISIPLAGSHITAFALAYALGGPILATLTGRLERRSVIVWTMAFFVFGNLMAAFGSSFETLLAARVVMALAAGLFAATAQATAVAMVDDHHRARAIAVVVGGTTVAVALGAPLGALIGTAIGWRGTFMTIAAVGTLAGAVLWWRLPRGLTGTPLSLGERVAGVMRPGVLPMLFTTLMTLTGAFAVFSYIAPLAMQGAGLSELALPAVLLAFGIGAVIGNIAGGQAADRFGATTTVCWSLGLVAVTLAALSAIPAFLPHEIAGPALIAMMIPWGVIGWAFPPAQSSRLVDLAPDAPALVLSLNVSALYFGVAFGSVVGGAVLDFGVASDLGWVGALFPVAGLAVTLIAGSRRPSPHAVAAE